MIIQCTFNLFYFFLNLIFFSKKEIYVRRSKVINRAVDTGARYHIRIYFRHSIYVEIVLFFIESSFNSYSWPFLEQKEK